MTTREGVSGAPKLKAAPTGCSNAVCGVVEASEAAGKKASLTVDVGDSSARESCVATERTPSRVHGKAPLASLKSKFYKNSRPT